MEKNRLLIVNKALKIAVNLCKPEEPGYKTLVEAKDFIEKELEAVKDTTQTVFKAEDFLKMHFSQARAQAKADETKFENTLLNELMDRGCVEQLRSNVAFAMCKGKWPTDIKKWCSSCYLKEKKAQKKV